MKFNSVALRRPDFGTGRPRRYRREAWITGPQERRSIAYHNYNADLQGARHLPVALDQAQVPVPVPVAARVAVATHPTARSRTSRHLVVADDVSAVDGDVEPLRQVR